MRKRARELTGGERLWRNFGGTTSVVYYETRKRELNRRLIYECTCDERLKAEVEGRHASHARGGDRHTRERKKKRRLLIATVIVHDECPSSQSCPRDSSVK
jgi:hypothetical protein